MIYWRVEVLAPTFLTSALDWDEWSASRPIRFNPEEKTILPIG
jgi:hypothetical protein